MNLAWWITLVWVLISLKYGSYSSGVTEQKKFVLSAKMSGRLTQWQLSQKNRVSRKQINLNNNVLAAQWGERSVFSAKNNSTSEMLKIYHFYAVWAIIFINKYGRALDDLG